MLDFELKKLKENSAMNSRMILNEKLHCLSLIMLLLIGTGVYAYEIRKEHRKIVLRWKKNEYINKLIKKRNGNGK